MTERVGDRRHREGAIGAGPVGQNARVTERARRRPGRPAGGQPVVDRALLLDAAERAIRREGESVSIDVIAREAGVTKPIVYDRIGGRAELANALAQRLADRLNEATAKAIAASSDGQAALCALLLASLRSLGENREVFRYVTNGSAEDRLDVARRSAAPLAAQIAAARSAQGLDPSVAGPWSYAIVGMLNLVGLWWISESDLPAERLAEQLAELLSPSMATPTPSPRRARVARHPA